MTYLDLDKVQCLGYVNAIYHSIIQDAQYSQD